MVDLVTYRKQETSILWKGMKL